MRRFFLFLSLLAVAAGNSAAEVPADFEMLLLPIVKSSDGAFGSHWSTQSWIFHGRPDWPRIRVGPFPPSPYPPPPPMWVDMISVWLERPGTRNPGVLLYVHRDDIQRFHLTVRLHGGANVVNLPIIRSTDYRRGPTRLFPIEESSEKRVNVRIYGKPGTTSEFRVRLVPASGGGTYFETAVSLETDDDRAGFEGTLVPVRPSYAEIPLPHVPTSYGTGTPFVEILPTDDTFEYWPMVTLTDNVTQAVEIFTPSP